MLRIGTSISVGSGSATLFWFNRWINDTPLAARFPELFAIAVDPRVSVETALIDLGRLAFHRPFGPPKVPAWDALLQDIVLLPMSVTDAPDAISWRLESSGRFSTRSLYAAIAPSPAPEPFGLIWDICLPLKIRIFLWQWIRGRLPSGVEVLKRNGPGDGLCPLCGMVEDANHVFFTCLTAHSLLQFPRDGWWTVVHLRFPRPSRRDPCLPPSLPTYPLALRRGPRLDAVDCPQ